MAPSRLPSDLVRDSKIETKIVGTTTNHVFYTPGGSAKERQLRKEEKWVRDEFLGQGAFGTVYRETCEAGERLDKVRAVKEIKKHVAAGEELDYTRELEAIVKFSNDRYSHCFVRSDGWFETSGSVFISMEYLELGDLQNHLARPLHESDARDITSQVLEGLQIMHENGFVHRDLKPGNIMVVAKRPWFVKIADFGISKRRLEDVTALHTLQRGTFGFAAPEVFGLGSSSDDGSYTSAVDMWSLGAVVHGILTSAPPFRGLSDVVKYVTGATEFPVADLQKQNTSEHGQDFITKLMACDPKDRPPAAIAASHAWMTMHFDAVPDIGVDPTDGFDNEDVTISVASLCWTNDETVAKLPVPLKAVPPLPSNYQTPSLEDCPTEPDITPGNSLPKDSTVVMKEAVIEAEVIASAIRHKAERLRIQTASEDDSESSITTDVPSDATRKPDGNVYKWRLTSQPYSEGFLEDKGLSKELETLMSSNPEVQSAYSSLLKAIDGQTSPDMRLSIRRVVGTNLVWNSQPSVPCGVCKDKAVPLNRTQELRCGHRLCEECLKRKFEESLVDTRVMPPTCCRNDPIPLELVQDLFDNSFKQLWNRSFVKFSVQDRLYCPTVRCVKWIPPEDFRRDGQGIQYAKCHRCKAKVCSVCNGEWASHDEPGSFIEEALQEGWQRCPKCMTMVKVEGCAVTCSCGDWFWKTCECSLFKLESVDYEPSEESRPDCRSTRSQYLLESKKTRFGEQRYDEFDRVPAATTQRSPSTPVAIPETPPRGRHDRNGHQQLPSSKSHSRQPDTYYEPPPGALSRHYGDSYRRAYDDPHPPRPRPAGQYQQDNSNQKSGEQTVKKQRPKKEIAADYIARSRGAPFRNVKESKHYGPEDVGYDGRTLPFRVKESKYYEQEDEGYNARTPVPFRTVKESKYYEPEDVAYRQIPYTYKDSDDNHQVYA